MLQGFSYAYAYLVALLLVVSLVSVLLGFLIGRDSGGRRNGKPEINFADSQQSPTPLDSEQFYLTTDAAVPDPGLTVSDAAMPDAQAVGPDLVTAEAGSEQTDSAYQPDAATSTLGAAQPAAVGLGAGVAAAAAATQSAAPEAAVATETPSAASEAAVAQSAQLGPEQDLSAESTADSEAAEDQARIHGVASDGSADLAAEQTAVQTSDSAGSEAKPAMTAGAAISDVEATERLERLQAELYRLETGAVSAWDRVVPQLEERIRELEHDNTRLMNELRAIEGQLMIKAGPPNRPRSDG
ncbi:MAG: hypothetical protein CSA64_02560 [Arachnia propionica]|nr:MAG: hypothetical protein CSA64_02560 [Arachnia propionica]